MESRPKAACPFTHNAPPLAEPDQAQYIRHHLNEFLERMVSGTLPLHLPPASSEGSVALLIKGRSYPGMALLPSNWTDLSCQRIKLMGERHHHCVIHCELALADHVHELDAGNYGGGRVE